LQSWDFVKRESPRDSSIYLSTNPQGLILGPVHLRSIAELSPSSIAGRIHLHSGGSIAQLTMHSREHLVLLRPGRFGLVLHTLFYSDEVRTLDEFRTDTEWVAPQELEVAHLLVESLAARFEPAKYKDRYRENLRALIDSKIRGEELKLGAAQPVPAPVADILEALKASLERLKKPVMVAQQPPQPVPAPKRTRKALAS
jgi:non-homologous end joining protein Ku